MATVEISLTQGKVAVIDECDWPLVRDFRWYAAKRPHTWYVFSHQPDSQVRIRIHRLILGVTDPRQLVDHRDGNGLNNTRENLRLASDLENARNQRKHRGGLSQFKGVSLVPRKSSVLWESMIYVDGRRVRLGHFDSEESAAHAYDRAAVEHFGEFANLNFPLAISQ